MLRASTVSFEGKYSGGSALRSYRVDWTPSLSGVTVVGTSHDCPIVATGLA